MTTSEQMLGYVEKGMDEVRISMSAGSRKGYMEYSGRDLYEKLLEQIRRMIEIRGGHPKPLLRIVFVLTQQNYREFPLLLRQAEEIGVDELQVQVLLNWGRGRLLDKAERGCALGEDEFEQARTTMIGAAEHASRVRVILPFSMDRTDQSWRKRGEPGQCQWPFNATWITANGHVTPCCNLHDPRQINLGNAFKSPLRNIWVGEAYEAFRAKYRADAIEACRFCQINYGRFKSYAYEREVV